MTGRTSLARDERGGASVEYAFVIAVLITLLIGIVQVGAVLKTRSEVSHAVGRAVRLIHIDPAISEASLQAQLVSFLPRGTADRVSVSTEPLSDLRALRLVVRFSVPVVIPFVPVPAIDMRLETLAPAFKPT